MNFKSPKNGKNFFENLRILYEKKPELDEIFRSLNAKKIPYGLFAGTEVWLLTSNRKSTDVDIIIGDEDSESVRKLFPNSFHKNETYGDFIYFHDHDIEFSYKLNPEGGGTIYQFRLTELAKKERLHVEHDSKEIYLINPADTIILKAILQRGIEQGKHDLEDIIALSEVYEIDKKYLAARLVECNCDNRVKKYLEKYKII